MKKKANKISKTALFLFPGQGSQHTGMGLDILDKYPKLEDFYNIANNILGYNILDIISDKDDTKLNQTLYTQPAIFIDSIIKDTLLLANNIFPTAVAGHSLGEYSALVSSNVIEFEDALKIIKIRSYEMQNAGNKNPGKMLAIIGASKEQIQEICNNGNILVVANYNAPDQIVLSGDIDSIDGAISDCKKNGIRRAIPLKTSGAFHSPLMKSARSALIEIIDSIEFKNTSIPVYQNTNPIPETNGKIIKNNLINQLEGSVHWVDTIKNMAKDHNQTFIEVGPGKVLYKLNNKILKKSDTLTFNMINLV